MILLKQPLKYSCSGRKNRKADLEVIVVGARAAGSKHLADELIGKDAPGDILPSRRNAAEGETEKGLLASLAEGGGDLTGLVCILRGGNQQATALHGKATDIRDAAADLNG